MKLLFFICSTFLMLNSAIAQNAIEKIKSYEDTLVFMIEKIRTAETLKEKFKINVRFENTLREVLRYDESFSFKFDTLSKVMSTKTSPDNAFRIFNWNIEVPKTEEHHFFCLIMKYDTRKEEYVIIELFDKSKFASRVEYNVYTNRTWIGALYYEIIPIKKGLSTIYTLLGWDGNNQLSNKKIIETMSFQGKNKVKFGFPIFKYDEDTKRRVIFQYNKQSYMSVRHLLIKKNEFIVFDHLSPTSPQLEGMYDWYVTDLSFDAFILENGKWKHLKDFDARTGKSRNDKHYSQPKPISPLE